MNLCDSRSIVEKYSSYSLSPIFIQGERVQIELDKNLGLIK